MSDNKVNKQKKLGVVETTGHAWDSDLQEYNNPLPRWWLWCFYGTVVFAVLYWFLYPSWPVGKGWLKGMKTVSYSVTDRSTGKESEREFRWNTRSLLLKDLTDAANNPQRKAMLGKVQAADYQQIARDPKIMEFVRSVGKGLFGDNCAACHGSGGQGVVGMYPNLTDDDWLWGGSMSQIHETLVQGRNGYMPAFGEVLQPNQLDDIARYVLTLSGEMESGEASERGKAIFHGQKGGCYYCHGADGKGLKALGSANLTDKIWTLVDIPVLSDGQQKVDAIKSFVAQGVYNRRLMPAWKDRLSPTDIKLLAVYVRQLGGSQ
ncbi:MAG: cytochrome C oxidase subunit III [Candidatus Contendobacter odensis]|uniref:Cbb3-type cytochrome c oxidase subunit n=1 Tax=Candidatus Contendibacter odensensis TaxID=1400860 RepID=A0A2G6PE84_9GAMM|nr:MAG: cytochrome C oxidase subunit III [Candidatus Contendobacter odensis]